MWVVGSSVNDPCPFLCYTVKLSCIQYTQTEKKNKFNFLCFNFSLSVDEADSRFNLTVIRSLGIFGDVYCFYYVNRLTASSSDFLVYGGVMNGGPGKLEFKDQQRSANITVQIFNDVVTENTEQFEIGLTTQNAINNGGVKITSPSQTTITILPNDNANGIIEFSYDSIDVILEEPEVAASSYMQQNTFHDFVVERNAGRFGKVILSWEVVNASQKYDVSPTSGILMFEEFDREKSFQIRAVADDVPELEKKLLVRLKIVSGFKN